MSELPVLPSAPNAWPRERADAARNRQRILDAAAALVAESGPEAVTMDRIAEAACVGKGTLFRRFGDRAGLLRTLVSEWEGVFQDELIRGAPPLGPGAPAAERLRAFGAAYLELLASHAPILAAAESGQAPGVRLASPPSQLYRTHLAVLLRGAAPSLDADYFADVLFTSLSPELFLHQRDERGMDGERLAAGWRDHVDALVALSDRPRAGAARTRGGTPPRPPESS